MAKKIGRPTKYSAELASKICERLSQGISLRTVCLADDMPDAANVFLWIGKYDEFREQYARAKEASALADSERLEQIGDEAIEAAHNADPKASGAVVSAYKLKADNMKWAMSKKMPKKYGDKVDVTSDGKRLPGGNTIVFTDFSDGTKGK